MKQVIIGTLLLCGVTGFAFSQDTDPAPKFEIADVHSSPKSQNMFMRPPAARGGRYELKNATMVDLIRTAYGFDADKIIGGPNWLEMDRFDVTGKLPPDSTPETQKVMLQGLLADRFQLKVHPETKPLPSYSLIQGKKLQLKEADGTGDSGCKPASSGGSPASGGIVMASSGSDGNPVRIAFGPGMTIHYVCRNVTMESFGAALKGMFGVSLGTAPVKDETGLKGAWNFDLTFSMQGMMMMSTNGASEQVTLFDALEKQAGLKLEEKKIPLPVMVVDSVNQKPTANPANLEAVMPSYPMPTEFDVASLKPTDTSAPMSMNLGVKPSGQFTGTGFPLRTYISIAFTGTLRDQLVGVPKFADSDRYDIIAKVPSRGPLGPATDLESVGPLLRALLVDRFKMTYHNEDRPVNAYSLVAAKPKLKKADPANRTSCKTANAPAGSPPGSRQIICLNATVAQFAERLQNASPDTSMPVLDATGIEGNYDFAVTYSMMAMMPAMRMAEGGAVGGSLGAVTVGVAGGAPGASEPSGGFTLAEALEKQLGLKLEMQKRTVPIVVIDHMEQKPTEN